MLEQGRTHMRIPTMRISRGSVGVALLAIGIALIALLPGTWGTAYGQTAGTPPPAPRPVTQTIDTRTGGTLVVPAISGGTAPALSIAIPQGATTSAVTVTATAPQVITNPNQLPSNIPPPPPAPPGSTNRITAVFSLDATLTGGQHVDAAHPFAQPVTITLPVPAETLAAAAGSGNTIVLAFYNEATGSWQEVPATVVNGVLVAQITHFSRWALIVRQVDAQQTVPTPPKTGAGTAAEASTGRASGVPHTPRDLLALTALLIATVGAGGAALAIVARHRPH